MHYTVGNPSLSTRAKAAETGVMTPTARRTPSNISTRGTALPRIVWPNPLPLTPDQWRSTRGDLRSAADRRKWALRHRGAAVDKWLCEWSFANGRTSIDEHRRRGRASSLRHTRLHVLGREAFPVDALNHAVPRLEGHDHPSQEYPQAQHAREACGNSLSDGHCDSPDRTHQPNRQGVDLPLVVGSAAFAGHTSSAAPEGLGMLGNPLHRRQGHIPEFTTRAHPRAAPLNPTNPLDAFGHAHDHAVGGELDLPEHPDSECITHLI
jgi:hypothetical protein